MKVQESIRGFDFHCHVDLLPDPVAVIERCASEGTVVLAVTTTPKAWPQNCKWSLQSGYVQAATGLHPELVGERYCEADLLIQQIGETRFVGEVGLDGSPQHQKSYSIQRDIFGRVLDTAQALGGRVLSIHSRRAASDVIAMIEERTEPKRVLCILHWFSGSVSEARRAAAAGCFFSINNAMLGQERGRKLIKSLPAERLLTETDSPFTMAGNRKSLPWDVITTSTRFSEVYGEVPNQTDVTFLTNARKVFRFARSKLPIDD